jgi:ankyrin repeat protein
MPTRDELNRFNTRVQTLGEAAAKGDLSTMRAMLVDEPALATHTRPFSDACKAGQPDAVRLLIEAGVDVNTTEGSGPGRTQKPLLWTIRPREWTAGHLRVLEALLDNGADPSGGSSDDIVTPLLAAAEWNHPEAISLLIERGARIGFYEAVAIADRVRVDEFLAKSPELAGAVRRCGVGFGGNPGTSVHVAAMSRLGNDDPLVAIRLASIAETLLTLGAPATPATIDGEFIPGPIANAARSGNVAVTRLLLHRGAAPQDVLVPALVESELDILDLVADSPLDVDVTGDPKLGNTVLHEAIRYGRLRAAEWLIARGASVTRTDQNCSTPLHYACSRGVSPEFVELLLASGADVKAKDKNDLTPLAVARQRQQRRLVEALESRGAPA